MMRPEIALLIIFLLSITASFLLGWQIHKKYNNQFRKTFAHNYYRGMSYLINEQTDGSVDKFIDSLLVNGETLEIHLTLGNLMRRKGEAAKAIKIHQNLLDSLQLNNNEQHEAQLELARDYVSAGLLDRAERLFQELVEVDSQYKYQALEHLIEIYQDEKEWEKAIHTANTLSVITDQKRSAELSISKAHFLCELALLALEGNEVGHAKSYLEQAIDVDKKSVRANLITAEISFNAAHYEDALGALKRIPEQDPDLINITLDLLCKVYGKLGNNGALLAELLHLLESHPSSEVMVRAAGEMRLIQGDHVAADFLVVQLKKRPSIKALTKLIDLHLHHSEGRAKENLLLLKQLVDKVIAEKPNYHCMKCGFAGSRLHWLCPGCKTWGSVRLIKGVAGD